jgi:uncharacterized protein
MNPVASFIKRYPQATFWVIAWATGYFGFYMNIKDPTHPWILAIYGTFLGGALVTAIADGRIGLIIYFSRIVHWRVRLKWYLVALFLPLVIRLVAFGLNIATGASVSPDYQMPAWSDLLIAFFWPSLLGIALAEEPGFRGFALPRLLLGRSALSASLLLGVLHAIWHLPLFIFGEDPPATILIVISGAILNTWLFNNTNGSVLICMVLHASVDLMVGIFNPLFSGADAQSHAFWQMVAFVVVAVLVIILTGRELGRKPTAAPDRMAVDQPLATK